MLVYYGIEENGTMYVRQEYGLLTLISKVGGFLNAVNKLFFIIVAIVGVINVNS